MKNKEDLSAMKLLLINFAAVLAHSDLKSMQNTGFHMSADEMEVVLDEYLGFCKTQYEMNVKLK